MKSPTHRLRARARQAVDRASASLTLVALPFVLAMALLKEAGGDENPFLVRAREARATAKRALDELLARVAGENRSNLTEEEETEYRRHMDEVKGLDARIQELQQADENERRAAERAAGVDPTGERIHVRSEPLTYGRQNRQVSYFRDLGMAHVGGDQEARERLQRHRAEMAEELPKREARMEREFRAGLESLSDGERRAAFERRDLSRVDGAGGEFVPPLWLMDELIGLARAGRPFLELVRNIPLPGGTDSINIPRLLTGTAVAAQSADNAAVAETDATTDSINAPVRTYAGQQDIALQALEQSPIAFDELIFADLRADYNAKVDAAALAGAGTSGTIKGLLAVTGVNAVTYTDATPTLQELYPKAADALSQAATARKRVPNVWIASPRRWFWATAQLDSTGRPLVMPNSAGTFNSLAAIRDQVFEGPAGELQGLPVVLDPNMPINLGAGTNEDRLIATNSADHVLFEGALRTRALPEVLSGTLTVRLQLYAYVAFTAERYPGATSVIAGTGLVTPTF
jgi:HK97 family phage major capsid protein